MKVAVAELRALTSLALARLGYTSEDASLIREALLYAELRGNNQGLIKIGTNAIPCDPKEGPIRILRKSAVSAVLDGNRRNGMVVMDRATEMAIEKSRQRGIAIVATRHTGTSTSAIGYYAERIARAGHIGFVFSGTPKVVAMEGSSEPTIGTNPIAVGLPTGGEPVMLDMATSAMAYFGVIEAKALGRQLPPGKAIDADGKDTNDPAKAIAGALKSFAGYKGAALALVVEALTGPLAGGALVGDKDVKTNRGNLIIAVDPDLLVERGEYEARMAKLAKRVRAAKRRPGVSEILLPGERGGRRAKSAKASGFHDMDAELFAQFKRVAEGG